MRRRMLNVLKALSLLACVASVVLWARSYYVPESLRTERNYYDSTRWRCVRYMALSSGGGIGLLLNDFTIYLGPGEIDELMAMERDGRVGRWTWRALRRERMEPETVRPYARGVVAPARRWLGFGFQTSKQASAHPNATWTVTVPWAVVALLTAAPPFGKPAARSTRAAVRRGWRAVLLARLRRRRRLARSCPHCGYDLRATPGRCPECGALSRPLTCSKI